VASAQTAGGCATGRSGADALSPADARTEVDEIEYLYDLAELLRELRKEFQETADFGPGASSAEYLNSSTLPHSRALQSIDTPAWSGSRLRFERFRMRSGSARKPGASCGG
jgi:hypothetical protein